MNVNLNTYEGLGRMVLALIIDVAVVQAQISPLFAVMSIYLFFTALIRWDPLYALLTILLPRRAHNALHHNLSHGVSN